MMRSRGERIEQVLVAQSRLPRHAQMSKRFETLPMNVLNMGNADESMTTDSRTVLDRAAVRSQQEPDEEGK